MKKRLIYWLDRMIYIWKDTMPESQEDDECYDTMQKELKELEKIRTWIKLKI